MELLATALKGKSDKHYQEVVLYQARLAQIEEKSDLAIADEGKIDIGRNQITHSVLKLLERVKKEFEVVG